MRANLRVWKKSLVARLVFYYLLLTLTIVVLLGSTAFLLARRAFQVSILDRLSVATTLKEDALSQWVADQTQDFLLLCHLPAIRAQAAILLDDGSSEAGRQTAYASLSRDLASAIERNSGWQEALILSRKSEIVLSTDKSREGDYRALAHYFTEGRQETYIQKVYPLPDTAIPTITIATPVLEGANREGGVFALHLNLERMDEIILELTGLGAGSESYLVDGYNVLISGKRFGRDDYPRGVHSAGIDAAVAGVDGSGLYLSYEGVAVIGVYRWIDDLDVALLTEMPQEAAFAPARQLAGVILAVGLVVAVILTLGIYLLALQIARPILSITRAAVAVAGGDLSSQAPILTEDEVGMLGRTFNQMTGRLRSLYEDLEQEIAERRRAQAQREGLITELEAKNTELQRFAYTVSHDLKSPLITIQGFLGFLQKDTARGDTEKVAHDIERMRSAADTMRQLLDGLLELSRIGRLVNPPEEIAFGELVREAAALVAGSIAERGVEMSIAPDLPSVYGDRVRLLEVLQNLIENAVKFMGDQPRPRIEIGGRGEGGEILCHVRDNGRGIDPRNHQKIFGLFDQLDPADSGTGIGLALARRIVEVHKGRIWVESEPGQGTTFFFTLPRDPWSASRDAA